MEQSQKRLWTLTWFSIAPMAVGTEEGCVRNDRMRNGNIGRSRP